MPRGSARRAGYGTPSGKKALSEDARGSARMPGGSARMPGTRRGGRGLSDEGGWGGEEGDVVPRMVSDTRVLCSAEDGSAEDDKCHEGIWCYEGG